MGILILESGKFASMLAVGEARRRYNLALLIVTDKVEDCPEGST